MVLKELRRRHRGLTVALLLGSMLAAHTSWADDQPDAAQAALERNTAELTQKKQEITELDRKITELKSHRDTAEAQASLLAQQLRRLTQQLRQAELELAHTELNTQLVRQEQGTIAAQVATLEQEDSDVREQLQFVLRRLYAYEQQSLVQLLMDDTSLGEVLVTRLSYERLHEQQRALLQDLQDRQHALQERREVLAVREEELVQLQELREQQQVALTHDRREQEAWLSAKRAEQLTYDHRLAEAEQARQEIAKHVFTLKNAGVTLKLTEATDMARLASQLTGVRAALLLGVLKVETNVGERIGGGVYPDDMQPESREAWLRITSKLGLDPHTTPISARPRHYQGWGGAMGPGQFMPATWETIEGRVGELLHKRTANPYELTDAFVATALFLADRGATQSGGEYEAVNRYLAGPNWQRFTWYGDRVLAVAKEYEQEGL